MIAGFAVWQALLTAILSRRDRRVAVHLGALAFTLLAAATGLQFHGAALTAAWARRRLRGDVARDSASGATWLRLAGALGFMVAIGRLGVLLSAPPLAAQRMLLNERTACGLFDHRPHLRSRVDAPISPGGPAITLGRTIEVVPSPSLVGCKAAIPGRGLRGDRPVLVDSPGGRLRRKVVVHYRIRPRRREHRVAGSPSP